MVKGGRRGNTYNHAVVFFGNYAIKLSRIGVLAVVCAAAVLVAGVVRAEAQGGEAAADKGAFCWCCRLIIGRGSQTWSGCARRRQSF